MTHKLKGYKTLMEILIRISNFYDSLEQIDCEIECLSARERLTDFDYKHDSNVLMFKY